MPRSHQTKRAAAIVDAASRPCRSASGEPSRRWDMAHKLKIGQLVRLKRRPLNQTGFGGAYQVVRLVPPDVDDTPAYRIKDETGVERPVRETEIQEV